MTQWLRGFGAALVLFFAAHAASAQQAPGLDLDDLLAGATRVAQAIDSGQAADLWEGASPTIRRGMGTPAFVNGLRARMALGTPAMRRWIQIAPLTAGPRDGVPPGNYMNFVFLAQFANGQQLHETVTLRWDEDRVWRLSGYMVH